MESLRRKLYTRAEMRLAAAAARGTQALGRTTQAAHSTIAVGDADIPLVETAEEARDTALELPAVAAEVEVAADDAYEAAMNVDEAHAAADQAVADALKAQQTADGKNTIYSQPITPVAHPDRPFKQSDIWYETVVVDGNTRIATVNVWDGTKWAPNALVGNSLLVPGSVGNVLIENGAITGTKLSVDALNFKTAVGVDITGSSISGSVFNVIGQGETALWSLTDAMNTADSSWIVKQFTQKSTVSSPVHSGTGAMRISTSVQPAWVRKTISPPSNAGGIAGSVWVWTPTSGTIIASVSASTDPTFTPPPVVVPAATWTEVPLSYDSVTGTSRFVYLGLHFDKPPAYAVFDDLRLTSANKSNQSLVVQRNTEGVPCLTGFNSKGLTLEVRTDTAAETGGAFIARRSSDGQSVYFDGDGVRQFKTAEWNISNQLFMLSKAGLTFNKDASALPTRLQSQSPQGLGVRVLTSDDSRAELVLDTWNTDIRLSPGKAAGPLANNGGNIVLDGPVKFRDDVDVDLSSYLLSNYRGSLTLYRRGGIWMFNYSAGGLGVFANGSGTTINTALPEQYRPDFNANGLIRFTGGHSGSCVITSAGLITLTNQTGADRNTANAQAVWPARL